MRRFYLPNQTFELNKALVIQNASEIHHMTNVLRFKKGDEVIIFNDEKKEAVCVIETFSTNQINLTVKKIIEKKEKKLPKIILGCAVPKKGKFEWIIEKCTELGVNEIYPMKTKRTEVVFSADKMKAKIKRFQTVAVNAAKQCQRNDVPKILPMTSLEDVIKKDFGFSLKLIPCLIKDRKPILEILSSHCEIESVSVLIGPEGDFTEEEVNKALALGYVPVSLGETTLKVETAAISVISCVKLFYDQLSI